jgi:hypothetical protein
MKKKIKDLTVKDMPKCWNTLFNISPAFMCLFTEDEERFNIAKNSIPKDILEKEIEIEDE